MNISTRNSQAAPQQASFDTEPLYSIAPQSHERQHTVHAYRSLISLYPPLLIIDADEERAQRMARMLTLSNYRPIVVSTPVHAFKRCLQENVVLQAVLLGRISNEHQFILQRLLQQLTYRQRFTIPLITLPEQIPDHIPLYAKATLQTSHIVSHSCAQVLEAIWRVLPTTHGQLQPAKHSMVLGVLPFYGIQPRVSRRQRSRNSHFHGVLKAAYDMMSTEQWEMLMIDVGLAQYRRMNSWPPVDDSYTIPAEYLSCLNQAVAFSCPEDPVGQLRRWSYNASQVALDEKAPPMLMQRVLKLATPRQRLSATLKAFTREMNEIRGEELHVWRPLTNGNFWLVHYSNLYAYGRTSLFNSEPMCHVWLASLEAILRMVHLERMWEVVELECSCQTQTGHCLFGVQRREVRR